MLNYILSKVVFIYVVIITISSCQNGNKKNILNNISDSIIYINVDSLMDELDKKKSNLTGPIKDFDDLKKIMPPYSKIFSGFKIVPLEYDSLSVIGQISDIKITSDKIIIFDRVYTKSLYIFTKDGKFLKRIRNIGKGPGEYIRITNFDINNKDNEILASTSSTRKIICYNFEGKFIREISSENTIKDLISWNNFLYINASHSRFTKKNDNYILYKINKNGKIIDKYFDRLIYSKGTEYVTFAVGGFYKTTDDFKFYMPFCDTIFSITNNTIHPYIVFNTKKYKLTKSDLIKTKKKNYRDLRKLNGIKGYSEYNNWAFFKMYIGRIAYPTFYNFKTHEIICSTFNLFDDIAFIFPNLIKISDKYMIGNISSRQTELMQSNIKSGKLNVNQETREKILSLDLIDSNPILVLYEFKE